MRSHTAPSNLRSAHRSFVLTGVCGWGFRSSESTMRAMEEAMPEAEKYASRSEPLAALIATAKGALEQARAAEAK